VGDGLVDNQRLIQLLADADFDGLLAVETDSLHTDYLDEDDAVAKSVTELRRLVGLAQDRPVAVTSKDARSRGSVTAKHGGKNSN